MNFYLLQIKRIIKEKKMSKSSFSKEIEVKKSTFNRMFQNDSIPKADVIQKILTVFLVNPSWFFTGQGEMFLTYANEQRPPPQEQEKSKDKKDNSIIEPALQSSQSSINPVVEACADSVRLLIRCMNERKAARVLQFVSQILSEDKVAGNNNPSNYTREKRQIG